MTFCSSLAFQALLHDATYAVFICCLKFLVYCTWHFVMYFEETGNRGLKFLKRSHLAPVCIDHEYVTIVIQ